MIDLTYLNDITDGDVATKKQLIELFFTQADEIKQRFIIAELSDDTVIDIKEGSEEATAWGCDLTHEYITINADYRS